MEENDSKRLVDKARDDYNLIAKEWDLSRNRPSQVKLDLVREIEADIAVLDVGCGNGLMLPYVLEKGAFYFGLDIAENLVEIARGRYAKEIEEGKAKFVIGEASELPFKDEEFDFVISFAVLHHLPSEELRKKFFEEIRRVLRPYGKAKITVWNLFNEWAKSRFDIGSQLEGQTSGDVTVPWKGTQGAIVNRYVHQFSIEELRSLAIGAGFTEIYIGYFNRAGALIDNGEELVMEIKG